LFDLWKRKPIKLKPGFGVISVKRAEACDLCVWVGLCEPVIGLVVEWVIHYISDG